MPKKAALAALIVYCLVSGEPEAESILLNVSACVPRWRLEQTDSCKSDLAEGKEGVRNYWRCAVGIAAQSPELPRTTCIYVRHLQLIIDPAQIRLVFGSKRRNVIDDTAQSEHAGN